MISYLDSLLSSKNPHHVLQQWGEQMILSLPDELQSVLVVCNPEDADTFVSSFLEALAKSVPREKTHLACFWHDSAGWINRQYVEPFEEKDIRSLVLAKSVLLDAESALSDIRQMQVGNQTIIIVAPIMSVTAREGILEEFPNASFVFFEDTDADSVDVGSLLGLERAPLPEIIKGRTLCRWVPQNIDELQAEYTKLTLESFERELPACDEARRKHLSWQMDRIRLAESASEFDALREGLKNLKATANHVEQLTRYVPPKKSRRRK